MRRAHTHERPAAPRQLVVIGSVVLVGAASVWLLAERSKDRPIEGGFWFERVTYESPRLGGSLTAQDMETIAAVAMAELTHAFAGLRFTLSNRRDVMYRVRVVQEVRDARFRRNVGVPGESRAVPGLGGQGTLNFYLHASNAEAYASATADRPTIIEAIGRGIGRGAVHEFTHQLLPKAPIHASTNIRSYEYRSAARPEQYYGPMEWDLAWPMLRERFGILTASEAR